MGKGEKAGGVAIRAACQAAFQVPWIRYQSRRSHPIGKVLSAIPILQTKKVKDRMGQKLD